MITLFEKESIVAQCRYEAKGDDRWLFAEPDYATVFVHTVATLNRHRGMLRIEQQCFLRRGEESPDQPWVKPEITLEPAVGERECLLSRIERMHEEFASKALEQFPQEYLV